MGGLGKTTLVKKVFDDAVVKNHFQSHVWITVSESFKIEEGNPTQQNADLASFASTEYHGDVYNLQLLTHGESWTLFCRKTFMENSCPSHLEGLSKAISNRCEGLPLAIVAISGLLSTKDKSSVDEWDKIYRSLGAELEGNDKLLSMNKILSINSLSTLSILASSNDGLRLLTVLDLRGALSETFPNEVLKLLQLRDSIPSYPFKNQCGFKAPIQIGRLSSSQKLCSIETNHDNGTILPGEVGELTQLRKLQVENLRNEDGRVLCSSLEKLNYLRSLVVRASGEDEIIDLDSLSSPP
ncbi:disease resistance protein RPM1-like [Camellia sinensis]|uniref:disease resistance protein RPM1-like n=1 Tax=Camellia sinensis TaxID=4442 RepID=UPI0010367F47|nr:disease resistance protein RPM1-like [Camellia sinensis]